MIAWIVTLMVTLQPLAPWKDTYAETAQGMVQGAQEAPLFEGVGALPKTLALDVSLAWFESRFDRAANGDHGKSHGLYQVQGPVIEDVKGQTIQANEMILQSFRVCKGKTLTEKLGWYAAGGNDCERGLRESRHRMGKALTLLKKFPPPIE